MSIKSLANMMAMAREQTEDPYLRHDVVKVLYFGGIRTKGTIT